MSSWQCLLFGPGLRPAGEPATLTIAGETILVRQAEGAAPTELAVPAAALRLRRVGVDERGLELAWTADAADLSWPEGTPPAVAASGADADPGSGAAPARFACHVLDGRRADALLAALPAGAQLEGRVVERYDRSRRLLRRAGLLAVAFVVLLPLLLLLLVLANLDAIAGIIVSRIPVSQETALRDRYVETFAADPRLRRDGLRHRVVTDIAGRLTAQDTRYDYVFFVADDPAVNAFALPGGVVVVNDGLIDATASAEELAGVLAHEVQHVELRHGLHAIVKQGGLSLAVTLLTGDASGTLAGEVGRQLLELKFSRDAELEADATGFERLRNAGIDPAGMASFFLRLDERRANGPPELFSTHPASERRARALRERLDEARELTAAARPLRFDYLDTWPPPRRAAAGRRTGARLGSPVHLAPVGVAPANGLPDGLHRGGAAQAAPAVREPAAARAA